jgi:hypothetical protein
VPLCAAAQVGETVVPAPSSKPSYTRAYLAIGAGVALSGVSFLLAEKADDAYDRYQHETDPETIQDDYDAAVRYDRLAGGALLVGQTAVVLGLYWRLLKREPKAHTALSSAAFAAPTLAAERAPGEAQSEPPAARAPAPRATLIAEPMPMRVGVQVRF